MKAFLVAAAVVTVAVLAVVAGAISYSHMAEVVASLVLGASAAVEASDPIGRHVVGRPAVALWRLDRLRWAALGECVRPGRESGSAPRIGGFVRASLGLLVVRQRSRVGRLD